MPTPTADSLFAHKTRTLDGQPQDLSAYRGKVLLVVNTASFCGYTPQYAGLTKLHEELAGRDFAVLGFPSNDFGAQEPGTPDEIADFCTTRYAIKFPLFEKVKTHGAGQSPIYAFLSQGHGAPRWNFHKYLVGKDGTVRQAFASSVAPDAPELRAAIETALRE